MSLENEVKKLTEQVLRVADALEANGPQTVQPQQQEEPAPAQTEGKAERQPSKGKGKAKKAEPEPEPEPQDDGGEPEDPPHYSNSQLRQIRKDLASRLTTLISQKGRSKAVDLLNEFSVNKLMEIPADQLDAFSERLRQYEEGGE